MQSDEKPSKIMRGVVVSDDMDKTIVVEFERTFQHPHTGKILRSKKKYKVHDEHEHARIGDTVEFFPVRPYSKTKYMDLARVVTPGQHYEGQKQ